MSLLSGLGQVAPAMVAAAVALCVWPRTLVPARGSGLAPLLSLVTVGAAVWIAGAWLLALLRVVQLATLLVLGVALPVLLALIAARRGGAGRPSPASGAESRLAAGLDLLDVDWRPAARGLAQRLRFAVRATIAALVRPLVRLPDAVLLAVLVATFAWFLAPFLVQAAPATPLGYEWLVLAKSLALNLGPFRAGVAPIGLPALMTALSTLFSLDMLNVLRLMGPLATLLLAAGAAALAEALSGSRWAGFVAAVAVGLTRLPGLGLAVWSPTAPLAGQLSAGAAMLLLGAAVRASAGEVNGAQRLTVLSGAFVTVALDPAIGLCALLVATALLLGIAANDGRRYRVVASIWLAGALAVLPAAVGVLLGHAPVAVVWGADSTALGPLARLATLLPGVIGALAVLVHRLLYPAVGSSQRGRLQAAYAVALLVSAALVATGLPLVSGAPLATGLLTVLAIPLASALLCSYALRRSTRTLAGGAIVAAYAAFAALPAAAPSLSRFEPVGSAAAYLRIAGSNPRYAWTIVSPVTQYAEVLGSGWHTELSQFVRAYSLAEAKDPRFLPKRAPNLPIKTPQIFLFVDLSPTGWGPVTPADARLPLPPAALSDPYTGADGAAIEARALLWAQAYLASHRTSANIYARTPSLFVLRIRQ